MRVRPAVALRVGTAGAVFLLCFVIGCVGDSWYQRFRAENFLKILMALQTGTTSEAQVRKALRSFGPGRSATRYGEPFLSRVWNEESQSWMTAEGRGYEFSNRGLKLLRLARPASFSATLFFRNGTLVSKYASLQTDDCWAQVREAAPEFDDLMYSPEGISIDRRGSPPTLILVRMTATAGRDVRERAYKLNVRELTSLTKTACKDAEELIAP